MNALRVLRALLGTVLFLHGLAHTLAGMRAEWAATGIPEGRYGTAVVWLVQAIWLLATGGFVVAGLGLWGVGAARRWWRPALVTAIPASLLLLALGWAPMMAAGVAIDLGLALLAWTWRDPAHPVHPMAAGPRRLRRRIIDTVATTFTAYLLLVIAVRPWIIHWGSTGAELRQSLPGDELYEPHRFHLQHAVTIHAPADRVWEWLIQIGQDRGGFYSYSWLENLMGLHVRNADRIVPEWQHRAVGDLVPSVPRGWLGGRFGELGWRVHRVEPPRALVLEKWGAFVLLPVDAHTTRLVARSGIGLDRWLLARPAELLAFEFPHWVMQRKMLLTLKERAEGSARAPGAGRPLAIGS